MGLLTPCFVPGEGFLYTIIVPGGGFLLPSSRVPGVCPGGGMVLDEIDTCITTAGTGQTTLRVCQRGRSHIILCSLTIT